MGGAQEYGPKCTGMSSCTLMSYGWTSHFPYLSHRHKTERLASTLLGTHRGYSSDQFNIKQVCAFWIMCYCWKRRRLWYLASKIPGPSGYPIFGQALKLTGTNEKCLKFLRNYIKKYYPTVKIWVGSWLWVSVSDPDDVETILKSTKCLGRKFLKDILDHGRAGDGLITLSGDKWAYHRREIMPTFKLSILKNYISIFQTHSFELVNKWSSEANGKEMDIFNVICYYNLHMVCSTIMGVDIDKNNQKLENYLNSIHDLKMFIMDCLRNPCLLILAKISFSTVAKKIKNYSNDLVDFTNFVVSEKISGVKNKILENKPNKEYESKSGNSKLGYLDHLVESLLSGSPVLSEEEIRGETVSTMFAGNPKYFTNPDKFDPDNFSPEKKSTRHPFVFKPFSDGPRVCVGAKYAMFQMKVMLSTILRYYKILPVGKLEDLERLETSISMTPVLGVKIRIILIRNVIEPDFYHLRINC
uniref:Cytochrome P450 n=1 Tax=Timema monikensis TaxID=170555 RepID=A0A7R9HQK1_9NEOP|nr:unnamed protein product [Timema monikensis]